MTDNTIDAGTTFPTAPYPGQNFFRTDLVQRFVYESGVWSSFLPNTNDDGIARLSVAIPAGMATNTVIKPIPGRILSIIVESAAGTNAMQFTNGVGGQAIAEIASGAPIGPISIEGGSPASASIVAVGNAGNPAVLVNFE
jgi:hypothetical protein